MINFFGFIRYLNNLRQNPLQRRTDTRIIRLARNRIPRPIGNRKNPYFKKEMKIAATSTLTNILPKKFTVK